MRRRDRRIRKEENEMSIRKAIVGAALSAVMLGTMAVPALAAGDGSQASPCGASHGAFADVNGNFGFLGALGGTPGYHNGAVGQEPGATGYNNSHADCQS
jgi:hypothetical protein